MNTSVQDITFIKQQLSEKELYIHFVIDLAFTIKRLVKNKELDFLLLIEPSPKNEWENLALMLPYLPKQLVLEHLDKLLEGFMDLNWPGSKILYGFLSEMDIEPLKLSFNKTLEKAIDLDDSGWIWSLLVFMKDERVSLEAYFSTEIEQAFNYLTSQGIDFD